MDGNSGAARGIGTSNVEAESEGVQSGEAEA